MYKLKKTSIISLFVLISILNYSKSLDDTIKEYEQKSYTRKINELNLRIYDAKNKEYKKGEWNEISITSNNNYSKINTSEGITNENEIKYGMLYYRNGYDFSNNKFLSNKVGISKTLNDLIYNDYKYNLEVNNLEKEKQKITNETTKNLEIRNLIDLYKNYKNKEYELEQGKILLEGKKKDYTILQKKYEIGDASKYDYDLAEYEYKVKQLEVDNLEKELKIYGEQFILYNVTLNSNDKLDDLKTIELSKEDFYNLRLSEADSLKIDSELNSLNTKKQIFDYKYPKVTADANYDFETKNATVGIGITKTFKVKNSAIENLKIESEKLKEEYNQKKNELISNVGQQMINYTTLQTNEIIKRKTVEITEKDYEIFKKKYELGTDSFANYVEKRNTYEKAKIDYVIAKNELAAFTQQIKYYK